MSGRNELLQRPGHLIAEPTPPDDIDVITQEILHNALSLERKAMLERYEDVLHRKPSASRIWNLYYQNVREYQEQVDVDFRKRLPGKYNAVAQSIGSMEENWEEATRLARVVLGQLKDGNLGFGGIVDSRAKGVLSHYLKTVDYDVPLEAVLDTIGVRLMVGTIRQARKVKDYLLTKYEVVDSRAINEKLREPVLDTFDNPKPNGFAYIRLNLKSPQGSKSKHFEIQIEALERFQKYGHREIMAIEFGYSSPKWGHFSPE